jgi:methionyl-tRNA formyltransferase
MAMRICFLAKKGKPGLSEVISYLKGRSVDVDLFLGDVGEEFPRKVIDGEYDLLVSYISPWIIPSKVLERTKRWNLNFHPGPPDYPGIGCFNFAIFESATEFGATAHIMTPSVDTGDIVEVIRFPMSKTETVKTLSEKTYGVLVELFTKVMKPVIEKDAITFSGERWQRKPYKRIELEKLATITPEMNENEINEVIRATYLPGKPGPFIELFGRRFEFNPDR